MLRSRTCVFTLWYMCYVLQMVNQQEHFHEFALRNVDYFVASTLRHECTRATLVGDVFRLSRSYNDIFDLTQVRNFLCKISCVKCNVSHSRRTFFCVCPISSASRLRKRFVSHFCFFNESHRQARLVRGTVDILNVSRHGVTVCRRSCSRVRVANE